MHFQNFRAVYLFLLVVFITTHIQVATGQTEKDWMDAYEFVYLDTVLKNTVYEVRYAGTNNFIGSPITGYESQRLVMTKAAGDALSDAENQFNELGYGLKIFDTYRPQRAVEHFKRWSNNLSDTLAKAQYYPEQNKEDLFDLGYISSRSGHSRGSTIDLTLYHLKSGEEVDMGGPYDYFGERSHHGFKDISLTQERNRELLKSILSKSGFRHYSKEWWHYTLRNEPYPDTYFDFIVND